jgi:hypothetical protein
MRAILFEDYTCANVMNPASKSQAFESHSVESPRGGPTDDWFRPRIVLGSAVAESDRHRSAEMADTKV